MKIDLIISTLRGGGAERVLLLLASSFIKRPGINVRIITLNKGEEYIIDRNLNRVSLDKGIIPNHTLRSFFNLLKFYRKKQNRPDIIISFITLTSLIAIVVAKFYNIKIIAAEHNNYKRNMGPEFLSLFTKKKLYKKADLVTVLTSYDVPYYKKYGVNVKVMPNPCTFKPLAELPQNRKKVILAIGKLDRYHHKGFDNLITIVEPILKKHHDWKLKIVGSGNEGLPFLQKLVSDKKLEDQIIFTGFIKNIPELMQESSIFILSSRYEGLPMVLLEAMSQGMACIAYNCVTGPSDIIQHNNNGLLIEDQNIEKMREGLEKLIVDKDLRKKFGENGLKSLKRFEIDTVIDDYINIFNEILA